MTDQPTSFRQRYADGLEKAFELTAAELLRTLPAAALTGVIGAAIGIGTTLRLGGPGGGALLGIGLACGAAGCAIGIRLVSGIANGTAHGIGHFLMPRGHTTPPAADYSKEEALVMQRDLAGALASYEATIAADPRIVDARLRAADLYAGGADDPRRAEVLYREVQRIPGVAVRDDVYASSRLVDLYAGVLQDTGRAVVELRRLIERHPETRAAADARRGLAALKARLQAEREEASRR